MIFKLRSRVYARIGWVSPVEVGREKAERIYVQITSKRKDYKIQGSRTHLYG